jgi:hypothetical protein
LLKNAAPITNSIGKRLLEKMGWKEGEGLGKFQTGLVAPIGPDIKVNRTGLASNEDIIEKNLNRANLNQLCGRNRKKFFCLMFYFNKESENE